MVTPQFATMVRMAKTLLSLHVSGWSRAWFCRWWRGCRDAVYRSRMSKIVLKCSAILTRIPLIATKLWWYRTGTSSLTSTFPDTRYGATGIAVGMITNIPPHNLAEVISAIHLMDNPDAVADLMEVLPGPDFSNWRIVMGKSGIRKAYQTGRGTLLFVRRSIFKTKRMVSNELSWSNYHMVNSQSIERIAGFSSRQGNWRYHWY